MTDPVVLLEALRRHAEKITLFCQVGAIAVPRPEQQLLAYLEGSVIEVQAQREGGIFHPKVWVLQLRGRRAAGDLPCTVPLPQRDLRPSLGYLPPPRGAAQAARARLLAEQALRGSASGTPEARYPTDLSPCTRGPRPNGARGQEGGTFGHPDPSLTSRVHNFGLGGQAADGPSRPADGVLVVSPYLVGSVVRSLVRDHGLKVLISRPEAFEEVVHNEGGRGPA